MSRVGTSDIGAGDGDYAEQSHQRNLPEVFWRRRWWVVAGVAVCLAGSIAYHFRQIPLFSSSSRLYIQQNGPTILGDDGLNLNQEVETQVELIKSTPLLTKVAEKSAVSKLPIFQDVDNPVAFIKSGLSVSFKGEFVNIGFTSTDADSSAMLTNEIVDSYASYIDEQRENTAAVVLDMLREEKQRRDTAYAEKLEESLTFKRDNGMLSFLDDRGNIVTERLGRLSQSLTDVQLEKIDAESHYQWVMKLAEEPKQLLEYARAEQSDRGSTIRLDTSAAPAGSSVAADAVLSAAIEVVEQELDDAEYAYRKLELARTADHPDVAAARQELELLRERIGRRIDRVKQRHAEALAREEAVRTATADEESKQATEEEQELAASYIAAAERRLEVATQREQQLASTFEEQRQLAFDLNAVAAESASLDSELARLQAATVVIDDRIKSINVNESSSVPNVHILEVGRPAVSPSNLSLSKSLGMGLVLGLLVGGGLAFGIDYLDQRITSLEEVGRLLDTAVLGIVPHIPGEAKDPARGRQVHLHSTSGIAESYRTIRTAMQFAMRELDARRLLVTSPMPADGKSTSTSNLAIAMAQTGKRVLLIDGDCRKPTQHKIFGLGSSGDVAGLTDVILDSLPVEQALIQTEVPGLTLLPCGGVPANPADVLNGQDLPDLLDRLQERFDLILIDSPPVAPVTDARIWGALCDATILVVRAETTTRRIAVHARDALESTGSQLLGAIVNDVPRRRDRHGYYYGYEYGYRQYQYEYESDEPKRRDRVSLESDAADSIADARAIDRDPARATRVESGADANGDSGGYTRSIKIDTDEVETSKSR